MEQEREPFQFWWTLHLKERTRKYADDNELSMATVIRLALGQYLRRNDPQPREHANATMD